MKSCPTCKAGYKGGSVCYRCKSDLTILLNIEKEALSRIQNSKYHLETGNHDKALNEVEKSLFLLKTEEGRRLKAYILACKGDFSKASGGLPEQQDVLKNRPGAGQSAKE